MTPASASFEIMVTDERARILSDAIAEVMHDWDNPELLKAWTPAKTTPKAKNSKPKKPRRRQK